MSTKRGLVVDDSKSARVVLSRMLEKFGISVDTVPPGKRGAPYHLHHAEEEVFLVLQGSGTLTLCGNEEKFRMM